MLRAVIPAGGFGTRFLPAAKAVPKELFPVLGRPVISFVVEEAVAAGCTEICIILRRGKEAIRSYFEPDPELEARLAASGKHEELEAIRSVTYGASISYVYQPEAKGLGDAVLKARAFCCDEPFLVLAGDTIIDPVVAPQLAATHRATGSSAVAVERVPPERVSRYGIVAPAEVGNRASESGAFRLESLVEKPAPEEAPSAYAISARYLFTAALWPILESTGPGKNGEIQLTDAMDSLAKLDSPGARGGMWAVPIPGKRYDLGNPRDFLACENELAARRWSGENTASV